MRKLILIFIFVSLFIIVMTTNSESITIDQKQRIVGNKSEITDEVGSLQTFPLNQDWIELNQADYAYSSAYEILVSNFDPRDKFVVGDKIRLTQSSTTKYFYITKVASTYIRVRAGTDYTVANATIDTIYFSKVGTPLEFPEWFDINSGIIIKDDDGDTVSQGLCTMSFKLQGTTLYITTNLNFDTNADATNFVQISVPFYEGTNETQIIGGGSSRQVVDPGEANHELYYITNAETLSGGLDNYFAIQQVDLGSIAGLTAFGMRNIIIAQIEP